MYNLYKEKKIVRNKFHIPKFNMRNTKLMTKHTIYFNIKNSIKH